MDLAGLLLLFGCDFVVTLTSVVTFTSMETLVLEVIRVYLALGEFLTLASFYFLRALTVRVVLVFLMSF